MTGTPGLQLSTTPALHYLIAGQGLAGTIFALLAAKRGRTVQVVDPEEPVTCSRVAAGLMNPISGPRLSLGEQEEAFWFAARDFYREWETVLGVRFFEERPILRLFTDAEQAERWKKREADPRYAPWYEALPPEWERRAVFGGFATKRCGRLDAVAFLDAAREWLRGRGAFRTGRVDEGAARGTTVWCLGHESRVQGPFREVPVRPARGTILTIRAPAFREPEIVHAGKWLVPFGDDLYRVGSTYEWEPGDALPSPESRAELSAFLDGFLPGPWELVQEDAGIRPMANRGRPFLARHPHRPGDVLFNGLGSRGSLLAPWFAARLLDHLEDGAALDPEVDAGRFLL